MEQELIQQAQARLAVLDVQQTNLASEIAQQKAQIAQVLQGYIKQHQKVVDAHSQEIQAARALLQKASPAPPEDLKSGSGVPPLVLTASKQLGLGAWVSGHWRSLVTMICVVIILLGIRKYGI
jgi:hypothetical protein